LYPRTDALEAARALAEDPATNNLAVDIASFSEEEGSWLGALGSRSFANAEGDWAVLQEQIKHAVGIAEVTPEDGLPAAMERAGVTARPRVTCEPGRYMGFFEAHIEQGAKLEQAGKKVGVVHTIVGSHSYNIRITGMQNHAGTTPMAVRQDAGMAALILGGRVNDAFAAEASDQTVWTFGIAEFLPGGRSIIPGGAELAFQFRDTDGPRLLRLDALLHKTAAATAAERRVKIECVKGGAGLPTGMDNRMQRCIEGAAEALVGPEGWMSMPSAAGHDAISLAKVMPSAMLFIPSIDGISHSFEEDSHHDDIVLGCQAYVDAIVVIMQSGAAKL
jgi:N-carbamoyl-L-amino-acid hydrolase